MTKEDYLNILQAYLSEFEGQCEYPIAVVGFQLDGGT